MVADLIYNIDKPERRRAYTHLGDRFVYLSKILVDFRNRWNKEYLLQLREYFKHKNEKGLDACNKDDIVFVHEPNKKRADFKTGITEN